MSAKIKRTCKHCGKEFEIYASALSGKTNSSGNYCSRKCYNEEQKTFTGEKNNHYTSVIVSCANCGKEIKKIPSRLKEYKNAFCSMKCKAEYHHNYIEGEKNCNWKGGASRFRGDDFEDVKKKYYSGKKNKYYRIRRLVFQACEYWKQQLNDKNPEEIPFNRIYYKKNPILTVQQQIFH